jgi:hypothetical protein
MRAEPTRPGVIVISITDPGDALLLDREWDWVLRLEFDDVSEREEILGTDIRLKNGKWGKPVPFTDEMAEIVMKVVMENPTSDFIVHCNAGVSRSVAVARFISEETGRTLILRGNCWSDENANGLVLRLLHRQVWFQENAEAVEKWFQENAEAVENSLSFNDEGGVGC